MSQLLGVNLQQDPQTAPLPSDDLPPAAAGGDPVPATASVSLTLPAQEGPAPVTDENSGPTINAKHAASVQASVISVSARPVLTAGALNASRPSDPARVAAVSPDQLLGGGSALMAGVVSSEDPTGTAPTIQSVPGDNTVLLQNALQNNGSTSQPAPIAKTLDASGTAQTTGITDAKAAVTRLAAEDSTPNVQGILGPTDDKKSAEQSGPAGADTAPDVLQIMTSAAKDPSACSQASEAPAHAGSTGESTGVRTHTTSPAERIDYQVSIIKDGSRLAVKLEPDGLGKLDIDLRLNKGVVSAQIQVSDDNARKVLEDNAQKIVDALVKEGISVGGFSVSLRGSGRGGADGHWQEQPGRMSVQTPEAVSRSARTAPRSLVSIFI